MAKSVRALMSICMLLALGCRTMGSHPLQKTSPAPEGNDDFRVFVDRECKVTDLKNSGITTVEAAPLVVALGTVLIPKIVEKVVDAGASYLQKRKDALTTSYSARGSQLFFANAGGETKPRRWLNCISLARGEFGKVETAEKTGLWPQTKLTDLKLKKRPNFYADFHISYSADATAFQIHPVFVEFHKTAAKRINKQKDLLLTGYFEAPFLTEDDSTNKRFGTFQIKLPKMREGTVLTEGELENITSQWIPMPAIPSETFTKDGKEKIIYGNLPFTIFVTVQETEEAGDLLLKAVSVAEASKADVSKALSDALLKQLKGDEEKEEKDKNDENNGDGVD